MTGRNAVSVSECDIWIEFSEYLDPANYVWLPDGFDIVVSRSKTETPVTFSSSCLEHLVLLLDTIEARESDTVLSGTGRLDVTIEDSVVTLHGRPQLVGSATEMADVVTTLIKSVFARLDEAGLDTGRIAEKNNRVPLTANR